MYIQAFTSSFLPASQHLASNPHPQTPLPSTRRVPACELRPLESISNALQQLPILATGIAACTVLSGQVPQQSQRLSSNSLPKVACINAPELLAPTRLQNVIAVKSPEEEKVVEVRSVNLFSGDEYLDLAKGSLLQLEPDPPTAKNPATKTPLTNSPDLQAYQSAAPIAPGPSTYPAGTNTSPAIPELAAAAGVHRAVNAPDRFLGLRAKVRPATIGLVGLGAFTSGSVLLRYFRQNGETSEKSSASASVINPAAVEDFHSVLCVHVPFCASERTTLINGLNTLADNARISTPEGMASAARDAAGLLLKENGLFEDSRQFAPYMDVFLAETFDSTQRRFSGHVVTEEHRIERILGKTIGYDVSPRARLGQYGVVSLVVATRQGVNLQCYDEGMTVVSRLRTALDGICRLKSGDILGMEMRWVPETETERSLTRAQLSDAFPFLRVA